AEPLGYLVASAVIAASAIACSARSAEQTSVVRVARLHSSAESDPPRASVATPPDSDRISRLAAISNTRIGTGAQNTSSPPLAVCAIDSAIEPRIRIFAERATS